MMNRFRTYTLSRIWITPISREPETGLTFEEAVALAQHFVSQFRSGERGVGAVVTNEAERSAEDETGLTFEEQAELDDAIEQARYLAGAA